MGVLGAADGQNDWCSLTRRRLAKAVPSRDGSGAASEPWPIAVLSGRATGGRKRCFYKRCWRIFWATCL